MKRRLGLSIVLFFVLIAKQYSYACEAETSLDEKSFEINLTQYLENLIGRILIAYILDFEKSSRSEFEDHSKRIFLKYCKENLKINDDDKAEALFDDACKESSIQKKLDSIFKN